MKTLTQGDRQRLFDSVRRIEAKAHDMFYAGPDWDEIAFPAYAAAVLDEIARLAAAERWHMKQHGLEDAP